VTLSVSLPEDGAWQDRELTPDQAATLASCGLAEVTRGSRTGHWRVRADPNAGKVGIARFGKGPDAVEVRVISKVPISRLLFLVGYARSGIDGLSWRDEEVDVGEATDVLPAVAHAFARAADRALRQGVLLGYRETDEAATVVRGRIRAADQWRRHYTLPLPVEIRFDDYTVDIPENQILLSAAERLMRLPDIPARTRTQLRHLVVRLDGVSRLVPGRPLPDWESTRLNGRFHTALALADLVLRGNAYEFDDGRAVRADGLIVQMWKIFEDFVTTALGEALRGHGGRTRQQDRRHHLDRRRVFQLLPDLVYDRRDADGHEMPYAVIDAKYKSAGPRREDMYQMLAYCTVLGLQRGHLISPGSPGGQRVHQIRRSQVEIVAHTLDLTLPPRELLGQIAALADEIAAMP
jgi:5-methylcytosine-specific restriction enzyme subunit McrC